MAKFSYDPEFDILYIRKEKAKIAFSIELASKVVVDVDHSHRVVGIEVFNASKLLNVSKNDLEKIEKADVSTFIQGDLYGARYYVVYSKTRIESQVAITPRKGPLLAMRSR